MAYKSLVEVLGRSKMSQAHAAGEINYAYPNGIPTTVFRDFLSSLPDQGSVEQAVLDNLKQLYETDELDKIEAKIGSRPGYEPGFNRYPLYDSFIRGQDDGGQPRWRGMRTWLRRPRNWPG